MPINHVQTVAYCSILVYLVYTDLRDRRIPNVVVLPAVAAALLKVILGGTWRNGVLGAIVGAAFLVLPIFLYGWDKAGLGDAKLALFIGLWLGYPAVVVAILVAALGISVLAMVSWLRGNYVRKASVPMAPFLAVGTFTVLVLGAVE